MIDDHGNTPNIFFSFFWRNFLVVCIFLGASFSTLSIIAQEGEAPPEPAPVTESAPEPVPEPQPESVEVIPEPVPEPQPESVEVIPEPVPEPQPESPSEEPSQADTTSESPSESGGFSSDSSSSPSEDASETSSLTLLETGDGVIPLLEGLLTPETEEVMTLFSNSDFLIEIEVIFSDLDTDVDTEIQNEPTLADNTDEDPNVDLIDPSIIPDPPGPIPEIEPDLPPQDETPVIESQGESQSTIGLLETLLDHEDLIVRTYDKDIVIDPLAIHTCRADIFRADLQTESSSRARVTLFQNKKKNLPSFLEIGALPPGLNVLFKANEEYSYVPGTRETVIEFEVTRQIGAWEGDFTIPIIYTLTGGTPSSVVCQINIIND
ncbi:hypothetical protein KA050_03100 [Candidatus Gracilibacteria bacterium]|nr:hypothetical protein [Candidatus Gracilibacteria bacterium]